MQWNHFQECQSRPFWIINEIGNEMGLKLWFTFKIEGKYHLKDSIVDSKYAYTLSAYLSMTFPQNSEQPSWILNPTWTPLK